MAGGMSGQELPGEPPSLAAIEHHALGVIDRLPPAFRAHLGDVVLLVEEEADEETLASLGLEHPLELTGVYHGRPVGEKSAFDSGAAPDRIHLYRMRSWRNGARRACGSTIWWRMSRSMRSDIISASATMTCTRSRTR